MYINAASLKLKVSFGGLGGSDSDSVARLRPAAPKRSRAQHIPERHPDIGKRTHAIRGRRVLFLLLSARIVGIVGVESGLFWRHRFRLGLGLGLSGRMQRKGAIGDSARKVVAAIVG